MSQESADKDRDALAVAKGILIFENWNKGQVIADEVTPQTVFLLADALCTMNLKLIDAQAAAIKAQRTVALPECGTIDPAFLDCVSDSRYSNEWVGIAFRNRMNTDTLYVKKAAPQVPDAAMLGGKGGDTTPSPQAPTDVVNTPAVAALSATGATYKEVGYINSDCWVEWKVQPYNMEPSQRLYVRSAKQRGTDG